MSTSVWWVRRDIRLGDNGALQSAAAAGTVVPLFVWEDNLLAGAGDFRRAFLFDALESLDDSVGRALIYRDGPAVTAVPEFCRLVGADTVHITEDFAPWGRARDAEVERALSASGVRLVRADTPYVIALIALAEGPVMMSNVVGCAPEDVIVGMPVEVLFETWSEEITVPKFRPVTAGA